MLKKILDPKSGKEEYMDTGAGGMSGQNSRDFHAVARDKFFSFSKFHKVAEICFSCGRHLSEKEISSCYEKNIVFVCYKCRKKYRPERLKDYVAKSVCFVCNKKRVMSEVELLSLYKLSIKDVSISGFGEKNIQAKCSCTTLMVSHKIITLRRPEQVTFKNKPRILGNYL